MTPLAVFFRTLSRTSAIFLGAVAVFLNPPLDWGASRTATAVTYESRDAMERATEQASAMREDFTRAIGMEISDMAEFDLVIAHLQVPELV